MLSLNQVDDRRHFLALLGTLALPFQAGRGGEDEASVRAVLARFRNAYEALDVAQFEAIVAKDVRFLDPTFNLKADGIDQLRPIIRDGAARIATMSLRVENEIISAPWAVLQQEQRFTMKSRPDKMIAVRGASIFRIAANRVQEWFDYYDVLGYQRQLKEAGAGGVVRFGAEIFPGPAGHRDGRVE